MYAVALPPDSPPHVPPPYPLRTPSVPPRTPRHPVTPYPPPPTQVKLVLAVLTALFVLIPFCYIPASAAVFVVKERTSKAQHLQLVSGVSASYYWLATYAWDYAMYCLMSAACMLIFVLYDEPGYVGDADQACYPSPYPSPQPSPSP